MQCSMWLAKADIFMSRGFSHLRAVNLSYTIYPKSNPNLSAEYELGAVQTRLVVSALGLLKCYQKLVIISGLELKRESLERLVKILGGIRDSDHSC